MAAAHRLFVWGVVATAFVPSVRAQVIDFERMPDGSIPTEGLVISNQFWQQYGVNFAFTNGKFPHIAQVGSPLFAFQSAYGDDTPAPGQNCGSFFLTDSSGLDSQLPPTLVITYAVPVSAASGVILDIDGLNFHEAWDIQAYNGTNLLATVSLTEASPNAGDGLATPWNFSRSTADITSIWIVYTGTKTNRIGLAFDNFSPSSPFLRPVLSQPAMTNQAVSFNLAADFGQTCRVEYASSPVSTNWQFLTNVVLSNAPSQAVIDVSASNATERFYRAKAVQ